MTRAQVVKGLRLGINFKIGKQKIYDYNKSYL